MASMDITPIITGASAEAYWRRKISEEIRAEAYQVRDSSDLYGVPLATIIDALADKVGRMDAPTGVPEPRLRYQDSRGRIWTQEGQTRYYSNSDDFGTQTLHIDKLNVHYGPLDKAEPLP